MKITYSLEVDEDYDSCADTLRRVFDKVAHEFFEHDVTNSRIETPFEIAEE